MLDNRMVMGKTDDGRDAVANRTHNLNPRQRALLISINGETDVGGLIARFGAGASETVSQLVERGLIAPLVPMPAGASSAPARRDAQSAAGAAITAARKNAVDGEIERPLDASPSAVSTKLDAARSTSAAGDWRALQQRAGDGLHAVMGAAADLLAMRLSRSRSEAEFFGHLERAFDLIGAAHGEAAVRDFQRQVSDQA